MTIDRHQLLSIAQDLQIFSKKNQSHIVNLVINGDHGHICVKPEDFRDIVNAAIQHLIAPHHMLADQGRPFNPSQPEPPLTHRERIAVATPICAQIMGGRVGEISSDTAEVDAHMAVIAANFIIAAVAAGSAE